MSKKSQHEAQIRYRNRHREKLNEKNRARYWANRDMSLERGRIWKENNKDRLIAYSREYEKTHKRQRKIKNKEYKARNRERFTQYTRDYRASHRDQDITTKRIYYENHAEKLRKYARDYRERNRQRFEDERRNALLIVGRGKIECVKCGCDNVVLSEINHINGGGKAERRVMSSQAIYRRIVDGRRTIKDLDLRCSICNLLHYLEIKYGKLPYEIKWIREKGTKKAD